MKKKEWICNYLGYWTRPCYEYSIEKPIACTKKPNMKPVFKQDEIKGDNR